MSFSFSFLSFSFKLREREREYTKFGIRRNSPKVTYLIFRRDSTGESFFFYGLIDFRLFLTLAWRKWLLRVSQIFFSSSSPGVLGFWFCLLRTLPNNYLFSFLFPLTGGSPHFRFRVPANHLASTFPPPGHAILLGLLDVIQVRLLSTDRLPQFTIMP